MKKEHKLERGARAYRAWKKAQARRSMLAQIYGADPPRERVRPKASKPVNLRGECE